MYILYAKYHIPTKKLNSTFMHYLSTQDTNEGERVQKMPSLKCCHFVKYYFLGIKYLMQIFNLSTRCMQSIRCQQQKLWYKLNSSCMDYLRTQNLYEYFLLTSKCSHFVKKLFSWYQIFSYKWSVSTLCIQNNRCHWQILWYKLNSPSMH